MVNRVCSYPVVPVAVQGMDEDITIGDFGVNEDGEQALCMFIAMADLDGGETLYRVMPLNNFFCDNSYDDTLNN